MTQLSKVRVREVCELQEREVWKKRRDVHLGTFGKMEMNNIAILIILSVVGYLMFISEFF